MRFGPALILSIAALAGCSTATTQTTTAVENPAASVAATRGSMSDAFGAMLNRERGQKNLPALAVSGTLAKVAQGHANDMSTFSYFSHTSRDGRKLGDRARAQGYGYCFVAENIAQGQRSEPEVLAAWMNSPGHRRNNLSTKATEFGLARAANNYWVLVLGNPGC